MQFFMEYVNKVIGKGKREKWVEEKVMNLLFYDDCNK